MSGVGVLDKAVVILAACVDGASLAELVDRTKLPRATAHRLAQALEIHRLLVRDAHGRWRPGPRLGELANSAPDVLLTAAEPMLTTLRDTTGESAQLYLRSGDRRLCAAACDAGSGLYYSVPVGALLPLDAGSGGKVLLAFGPDGDRFPAVPAAELAAIARRGWAASSAERQDGVASVSAPILAGQELLGALCVSGPASRLTQAACRQLAPVVIAAAGELCLLAGS